MAHASRFHVVMPRERAGPQVQLPNGVHLFLRWLEIASDQVLHHPFRLDGFGQHRRSSLKVPAKCYLRRSFPMGPTNFTESFVGENAVLTLSKRTPRFRPHAKLTHHGKFAWSLKEGVNFNLIGSWSRTAAPSVQFSLDRNTSTTRSSSPCAWATAFATSTTSSRSSCCAARTCRSRC